MTRFDRAFNYLTGIAPVLLMTGLALLSFALVKQTNYTAPTNPVNSRPNNDQDYYLNAFSLSKYSYSGQLGAYIKGKQAQHFEQSQELSVENFQFFFVKDSEQSFGSSSTAIVNDGANTVAMSGKVKVRLKVNSLAK